jgi:hypothetical protein
MEAQVKTLTTTEIKKIIKDKEKVIKGKTPILK